MNVDSTFFLSAMLKTSLLIAGSLLLVFALWKAEPCWRVLVLRAVLLALPVVALACAMAPVFRFPLVSLPGDIAESGGGNAQTLPTVLVPSGEVRSVEAGREMTVADVAVESVATNSSFPIAQTLLGLWLLGIFVLLVRDAVLKRRVVSELAEAVDGDQSLQGEWQSVCAEFGIESIPALKVGGMESSPFLMGGLAPQLLVPSSLAQVRSVSLRQHVFRHEAAHLAAGDLRWLAAMRFLTRVFWLQPLMWLVEAKHLQACEEAADAEAARRGGTQQYRGALASLALELVPTGRAIPATAFFRGPSVVRRLRAVVRHGELRPPSRWRSLVLMAVIVAMAAVLGNAGLAQRSEDSTIELQMAELSYEGYQESKEKGDSVRAIEYLKMAIEYLPTGPNWEKRREEWQQELKRWVFLDQVKTNWDEPQRADMAEKSQETVTRALREIIIPSIEFLDVPLKKAIEVVSQQAEESNGEATLPFRFEFALEEGEQDTAITLRLKNVPLNEALRYITGLAQVKFAIESTAEGNVIRIVPLAIVNEDLYTTVYDVVGIREFEKDDGVAAKTVLENAGIVFPKGASAMLHAERGQLIVRNTASQMKLVEAWLEDAKKRALDPSDIWFRAYTLMKEGKALEDQGKLLEALGKYEDSKKRFDFVNQYHQAFHPEIVRFRRTELGQRINELRGKMGNVSRLVPIHPVQLPERSDDSDEGKLGALLPAVPVQPSDSIVGLLDELSPSVLQIRAAECESNVGDDGGQLQILRVQVAAAFADSEKIQPGKMSLVVRFYDRVGTSELQIGSGETETLFPTGPYNWADSSSSETVVVEYRLPKAEKGNDNREYFGYVAELYYDDVLQEVTANPSKLVRLVK